MCIYVCIDIYSLEIVDCPTQYTWLAQCFSTYFLLPEQSEYATAIFALFPLFTLFVIFALFTLFAIFAIFLDKLTREIHQVLITNHRASAGYI